MKREAVFNQISKERDRQDEQWGGPLHDIEHDVQGWVACFVNFLARAVNKEAAWGLDLEVARLAFLKVAALCVAAIESIDLKLTEVKK